MFMYGCSTAFLGNCAQIRQKFRLIAWFASFHQHPTTWLVARIQRIGEESAENYAFALGRLETASYHLLVLALPSRIPISTHPAKSIAQTAVISTIINSSPAINLALSRLPSSASKNRSNVCVPRRTRSGIALISAPPPPRILRSANYGC